MLRMPGTLYIVATPIGNLEDITQRAVRILRDVDLIACEDTRHTRKLLNHFGIDRRTISYHEHNERERAAELCELLEAGKDIALVSDAGTPLVSDPGFRLTSLAVEKGIRVVPVPGATAFVAGLSGAGLALDQIFYGGFLPARANARRAKLEELRTVPATLVFYEAPHRIAATLRDASEVLGNRPAVIARELTKVHEEFQRGSLRELADAFDAKKEARGEMVLLIGGPQSNLSDDHEEHRPSSGALAELVSRFEGEGLETKAALKKAARELGLKRDEAYRLWEAQKKRRSR
jgi:16S rRNA (cytidine1402-2'-O)-methyltransferase